MNFSCVIDQRDDLNIHASLQRNVKGPVVLCNPPFPSAQHGKPPLRRPREHLILERRKQEELREEANAIVSYNKQFDLKVRLPNILVYYKMTCPCCFMLIMSTNTSHLEYILLQ